MSEIQVHGQLTQVDENGDVTIMLPHTTTDDIGGVLPVEKGGTGVNNKEDIYKTVAITEVNTTVTSLNGYTNPGWYHFNSGIVPASIHPQCIIGDDGYSTDTNDSYTPEGYLYVMSIDDYEGSGEGRYICNQFWFASNMKKKYQRMQVIHGASTAWTSWTNTNKDNIATVNVNNTNELGWYLVATGTLLSNLTVSLIILINSVSSDINNCNSGILILDLICDSSGNILFENIDAGRFGWLVANGITYNDYGLYINDNRWFLYYNASNVNTATTFSVISASKDRYILYTDPAKETSDPTITKPSVLLNGTVKYATHADTADTITTILPISKGGTGADNPTDALLSLTFKGDIAYGFNLNVINTVDDIGYYDIKKDSSITNYPEDSVKRSILSVVPVPLSYSDNITDAYTYQRIVETSDNNIYDRVYDPVEHTWSPWILQSKRKIAIVGKTEGDAEGWYKVATFSGLSAMDTISLTFLVVNNGQKNSGILNIHISSNADNTTLTCDKFEWMICTNINPSDYKIIKSNSNFILYHKIRNNYNRTTFTVINDTFRDTLMPVPNKKYELFSNIDKETTTSVENIGGILSTIWEPEKEPPAYKVPFFITTGMSTYNSNESLYTIEILDDTVIDESTLIYVKFTQDSLAGANIRIYNGTNHSSPITIYYNDNEINTGDIKSGIILPLIYHNGDFLVVGKL